MKSAATMRSAAVAAFSRSTICAAFAAIESHSLLRRCVGKERFGVAVEDLLVDLVRKAETAPIFREAFERQGRPVPAEHHAVLQPAADLASQRRREIFRRPAVQL